MKKSTKAVTTKSTTTKEESVMKKSTKSVNTTAEKNMNKEEKIVKSVNTQNNTQNSITINGVTIQLTEEQSALLAASLMFPTPSVKAAPSVKATKSAKAVAVAESVAEDVKPAKATATTKKSTVKSVPAQSAAADDNKLTDFADFEVQIDGNKLSFTAPEGKFLAYKTARYALNNRLKAICKKHAFNCAYNDKVWAWELKTMLGKPLSKTKMATIKAAVEAPVTVAELEDVRNRWSKKSSR